MSFKALLIVQKESFNVRRFDWEVHQNTDAINRPDAYVHGGTLNLELDSEPSDLLQSWALADTIKLEVTLKVFKADGVGERKLIRFSDAYCVEFSKRFNSLGTGNDTLTKQSMVMFLTVSANKLICGEMTIDNQWPAAGAAGSSK